MSQNIQRELESALDSGSSYEALQLLKSLLFRSKNTPGQDASASSLFVRGLKDFVERNNVSCAFDLCKAFVESLSRRKDTSEVNQSTVEVIASSLEYMKRFPNERSEYVRMLLKWAQEKQPFVVRQPSGVQTSLDLHRILGDQFLSENDVSQAFYHYVRSDDAQACASCVLNMQKSLGYPSEFDLFTAQVILQLLVLKHVDMAERVYKIIMSDEGNTRRRAGRSAVMFNFLDLLIETCKKRPRNVHNFELLSRGYGRVYGCDPVLEDYMKMIGQHLFGIEGDGPSSGGGGGFFAEAMRNLLSSSPLVQQQDGEDTSINQDSPNSSATDNCRNAM